MSTPSNVPGGDDLTPGGPTDTKDQIDDTTHETKPPKENSVSYDAYKKAVDEAKAAKRRVAEFEKAKKEAEDKSLAEQGNYKKLLEQRENELKEATEKLNSVESRISESRKLSSVLEKVSGEVPKKYWNLIDLEDVAVDPVTGEPDEKSAIQAAKAFEKAFPEVVRKGNGNTPPNDAPRGGGAKLTYAEWQKLPLKEQQGRIKDVDKSTI